MGVPGYVFGQDGVHSVEQFFLVFEQVEQQERDYRQAEQQRHRSGQTTQRLGSDAERGAAQRAAERLRPFLHLRLDLVRDLLVVLLGQLFDGGLDVFVYLRDRFDEFPRFLDYGRNGEEDEQDDYGQEGDVDKRD